jgi:acetate---CoA ligase (ADP-forming)
VESRQAANLEDACSVAAALGFPVVLKGLAPGVAHKNKLGLVAAGLADKAALEAAWARMEASIKSHGIARDKVSFIVQPMKAARAELIAGVSWEPPLGHFLVAGLGGIYTEALDESLLFPVPVSEAAMRAKLQRSRLGRLLTAIDSGSGGAQLDGLIQTLASLQKLVLAHGDRVESVDVNPVLLTDSGCVAVDALVVLRERE